MMQAAAGQVLRKPFCMDIYNSVDLSLNNQEVHRSVIKPNIIPMNPKIAKDGRPNNMKTTKRLYPYVSCAAGVGST